MTTETLDKLYLEWSQFTKARNRREIRAVEMLRAIRFEYARKLKPKTKRDINILIDELSH